MNTLSHKQKRFIYEYLLDINATQAAIRSGYSVHTARQIGQKLLTNVDIKREIDFETFKFHEKQKKRLLVASEKAINALLDVLEHGTGAAKINAANSILDRSGHGFIDKKSDEFNKKERYERSIKDGAEMTKRMLELLTPIAENQNLG